MTGARLGERSFARAARPRQPAPLRPGDRVGLVAASSALDDLERLQAGIAVLEGWGLQVAAHAAPLRRWGYLAGADPERRSDLLASRADPVSVAGAEAGGEQAALLACIRGGWGAARLLEQRQLLFGDPLADLDGIAWSGGSATGPLLVGNLTVATHLLGTRHLPDLQGAILILEDVGEAPYRLDRMLTHWRLCGALQQLGGIGFGRFSGCDDPDDVPGKTSAELARSFSAEQVLRDRTADLGIPVLAGLPVGHEPGNAALPLGVRARLDGQRGQLQILA